MKKHSIRQLHTLCWEVIDKKGLDGLKAHFPEFSITSLLDFLLLPAIEKANESISNLHVPHDCLFEWIMSALDTMQVYRGETLRLCDEIILAPTWLDAFRQKSNIWLQPLYNKLEPSNRLPYFLWKGGFFSSFCPVLKSWIHDDTPDQAETLAILDQEIKKISRRRQLLQSFDFAKAL